MSFAIGIQWLRYTSLCVEPVSSNHERPGMHPSSSSSREHRLRASFNLELLLLLSVTGFSTHICART
jgi:hypothetical protein